MPTSPASLAEQGQLKLLEGSPEAAVTRLDRAVALAPREAGWWSDLAAAHLALPQDPRHIVAALVAADRAVELDPGLKEVLFNRAVALQRLSLPSEARAAWERYLAVGDDPEWIAEAKAHRGELDHPPEVKRWEPMPATLRHASLQGDRAGIDRVVSRFPQRARLHAEEDLLAQWAQAVQSGQDEAAAQTLREARDIGEALARFHGDRLLLESVEAIERGGGPARGRLVAGHLAFQEGLKKFQAQDPEGAGPPFEAAQRNLREAGSPFSLWASFRLAHRDFLIGAADRALARFTQLRQVADKHSYKSLSGRASWLMGTVLLFQARPSEALAALDRAAEVLSELREVNNIAGAHMLLARTLDFLGDSQAAWSHRLAALRGAVEAGDADRMRLVFADTAWDFPDPKIALYFQTEAVRAARQLKDPGHLATALRQRAAIRHRSGDWAGALSDLRGAQAEANRLTSAAARATTFYELRLTEAQIRRERDPAGALAAAEAALALGKDRYFIPALLVERARAHIGLGDPVAAERDLDAATAEIEAQRDGIDEALQRVSYLDQAREAFERVVDLRLANGRGNEAALDAAEKTRSRVLFEWAANLPPGVPGRAAALRAAVEPRPVADLRRELPSGMVAVEYLIREDHTLAWIFASDRVELVVLPAGATALEQRWETWRQALRGRDRDQERRAASDLHQLLIAPLARHLHPRDTLVFIPDKSLYAVPFAALLDPATGHRLIQDRTLFVAPSANLLTICLERARALRTSAAAGTLIVADPAIDPALQLDLSSLPAALGEAKAIAALHSPARILSGSKATKSRFLSEAGRYGILHFAGHALRHRDNPLLSALVLAPDPAAPGASLLYAHELLGRRFDGTRLVVLSACSTGVGTPGKTEGALSLAAPFLAAGVPAVVASLWDVSDVTSAPLMSSFHRHLHQGEDVATALRSAQIEMLTGGSPELAAPRAWAPFELIGAR
jgi:CHAT domain-containing protein